MVGNWLAVHVQGTCAPEEVEALRQAIAVDDNYRYLSNTWNGYGLLDWPAEEIDLVGNLTRPTFFLANIVAELRRLTAIAPSLQLKVHCREMYGAGRCGATLTVKDREVRIDPPEVEEVSTFETHRPEMTNGERSSDRSFRSRRQSTSIHS